MTAQSAQHLIMGSARRVHFLLRVARSTNQLTNQPTNQPTHPSKSGDLREERSIFPCWLKPFLRYELHCRNVWTASLKLNRMERTDLLILTAGLVIMLRTVASGGERY